MQTDWIHENQSRESPHTRKKKWNDFSRLCWLAGLCYVMDDAMCVLCDRWPGHRSVCDSFAGFTFYRCVMLLLQYQFDFIYGWLAGWLTGWLFGNCVTTQQPINEPKLSELADRCRCEPIFFILFFWFRFSVRMMLHKWKVLSANESASFGIHKSIKRKILSYIEREIKSWERTVLLLVLVLLLSLLQQQNQCTSQPIWSTHEWDYKTLVREDKRCDLINQ